MAPFSKVHSKLHHRAMLCDEAIISEEDLQNYVREICSSTSMVIAQLHAWSTGNRMNDKTNKKFLVSDFYKAVDPPELYANEMFELIKVDGSTSWDRLSLGVLASCETSCSVLAKPTC